jgi:isopentenyl-diphosphate delta-isomerase
MNEYIILVDEQDQEIGTEEKLKVHQKGLLHRAFSIFIFNKKKELLLQKRALNKYHSGGLWANTCCGHPRPNESINDAAKRRLNEEMGISTQLFSAGKFHYNRNILLYNKQKFLTENEIDHVFYGFFDEPPKPNNLEICEYCWADINKIKKLQKIDPSIFSVWFSLAFNHLIKHSSLFF